MRYNKISTLHVIEFPFIFFLFHSMCFSRDISQQTIQLDSIRFGSIRFDGISYSYYIPDMLYILVCSEMRTVCYVCVCVCVCVCEEAEERGKSHLDHLNLMNIYQIPIRIHCCTLQYAMHALL